MTNANLINAMGHIDPKLIADAAPDVSHKKPAHKAWKRWVSAVVAACLCLMIAGVAYFVCTNGNDSSTIYPEYTETSSFYYKGDICENGFVIVTHEDFSENSITLLIDKKTSDTLTVAFRGWRSDKSDALICDFEDLVFCVNGEKVDKIPASPGKYEVKIDYGRFASKCDKLDPYMFVSGVGYFCLTPTEYQIEGDIDYSKLTKDPTVG